MTVVTLGRRERLAAALLVCLVEISIPQYTKKDRVVGCTRPESDSTRLRSEPWDPRPKELIGVGEPPAARPRARPPQCSRRHWFEMQDPNPVQLTRVLYAGPATHSVHVGPEVQNPSVTQ